MSEFKGTKGDWEVTEQLTNNGSFFRIKGESEKVANVVTRDFERAEANAKLIACAPEMLEALESFVSAIESEEIIINENFDNDGFENCGGRLYEIFKSLIKKATE